MRKIIFKPARNSHIIRRRSNFISLVRHFFFLKKQKKKTREKGNRVREKGYWKCIWEITFYSVFLYDFHWFVVCLGMFIRFASRSLLNYECVMLVAHSYSSSLREHQHRYHRPSPKNDMHERIACVLGIVTNTSALFFFFLLIRCDFIAFWTRLKVQCLCIDVYWI